jgi:hypothetical protein
MSNTKPAMKERSALIGGECRYRHVALFALAELYGK